MSLTPDEVRELAARGEGTFLDFKEQDYNWSGSGKSANAELAKDLMAMANALGPGTAPAHILIGVKNDGTIVGIPAGSHEDDAKLHQKVRDLFIRPPVFEYTPVNVDGCSVGVYTIKPGGRPHFPLRDSPPSLQKHVAKYRNGTATETSSPNMILEWDREDDPIRHQQGLLEFRKSEFEIKRQEAQARIQARFGLDTRRGQPYDQDGDRILIYLSLRNDGQCGFFVTSFEWKVTWKQVFIEELERQGTPLPPDYIPPGDKTSFVDEFVKINDQWDYNFIWKREDRIQHFAKYGLASIVGTVGIRPEWQTFHFDVICRSELGAEGTLSYSI